MEKINMFAYDTNTQEINSYEKEYMEEFELEIEENHEEELRDFLIKD